MFEFEKPASSLADAASQTRTGYYWYIYGGNDYTGFDFDYKPVPWEKDYIHVWPNQWQQDGEVYLAHKNNNGQHHYHATPVKRLPVKEYWDIPSYVDTTSIPWDWCPDPCAPPYNYVFGNQWNPATIDPTAIYRVPGATEDQYMDEHVIVLPVMTNWEVLDEIVDFDYSWRPNPTEPPYIYIFGNQWLTPEMRPALKYTVPGATEIKYMPEPRARRTSNPSKFKTNYRVDFDYSWEPDPGSPPYNYVFGNQWYPANIMPTVEYPMAGATETKFVDYPTATLLERHDNKWHTLEHCEWDYSWVPDPGEPAYIYVFGNQWHGPTIMPTVEYHVPGATERKFMDEPRAKLIADETNWTIPEEIDRANVDFSWVPNPGSPPYIYHFGSTYQISTGLMYTVPGATDPRFEGEAPRIQKEKTVVDVLDIFFVDMNNATAQTRYERLRGQYPKIQKIRYANSMMDTIQRCVNRAKTNKFWVISSEYNYDDFDFAWHAEPWQSYMTHVFPSQHQKWSDTFLINKWEFERHAKWATKLEEFPNLNFVKDQQVTRPDNISNIYYVDHGNHISRHQYEYLRTEHPDMVITRFVDNYLDTFKRIMATAETEYVWIINSVCNYTTFDFSWVPEPWQAEMIHVFPSDNQARGDTFYIHVESFKKQMIELDMLDWFNVINYCTDQRVERWDMPIHHYETDDLITEIKNYKFEDPFVLFTNQKMLSLTDSVCLWTKKDRVVARLSESGATVIVPRDIKADLRTQIYDYPYIDASKRTVAEYYTGKNYPGLDIVYISNGEPDEEKWYDHLCYQSNNTSKDIKWIRGVNGRTQAYQAAARASRTPWFFAVFAKLEVFGHAFPWFEWMPDYFQEPKHYIFNSRNPVNGLEYGHQGIIAYNKRLVLENNTPGIDFTLTQPHESVPILSGIAHYNQSPWMTWRTAFREVIKLKYFMATEPTLETEHRLNTWLTVADEKQPFAHMSTYGARDAVTYYNTVDGNYTELMKSFEWNWLHSHYEEIYGVDDTRIW